MIPDKPKCAPILATWLKNFADLNIYDLYRKNYNVESPDLTANSENRFAQVEVGGETKTYKRGHTMVERTPWVKDWLSEE